MTDTPLTNKVMFWTSLFGALLTILLWKGQLFFSKNIAFPVGHDGYSVMKWAYTGFVLSFAPVTLISSTQRDAALGALQVLVAASVVASFFKAMGNVDRGIFSGSAFQEFAFQTFWLFGLFLFPVCIGMLVLRTILDAVFPQRQRFSQ
jgi:hypothetical protein